MPAPSSLKSLNTSSSIADIVEAGANSGIRMSCSNWLFLQSTKHPDALHYATIGLGLGFAARIGGILCGHQQKQTIDFLSTNALQKFTTFMQRGASLALILNKYYHSCCQGKPLVSLIQAEILTPLPALGIGAAQDIVNHLLFFKGRPSSPTPSMFCAKLGLGALNGALSSLKICYNMQAPIKTALVAISTSTLLGISFETCEPTKAHECWHISLNALRTGTTFVGLAQLFKASPKMTAAIFGAGAITGAVIKGALLCSTNSSLKEKLKIVNTLVTGK